MRLSFSVVSGHVHVYISVTAIITVSAQSEDYCRFHSFYVHHKDVNTPLAPAVIATSDFLRRAYQACEQHLSSKLLK